MLPTVQRYFVNHSSHSQSASGFPHSVSENISGRREQEDDKTLSSRQELNFGEEKETEHTEGKRSYDRQRQTLQDTQDD